MKKYYVVIVKWANGKETRYRAPSTSSSPVSAAFDVAVLWAMDFAKEGSKHITSVTVQTRRTKIEEVDIIA